MVSFSHLVRFECCEDVTAYYADLGPNADGPPVRGTQLGAFDTFQDLANKSGKKGVTVSRTGDFQKDMIFSPDRTLSHLSQGTTIPAGTAVITGTPQGAFLTPKSLLQDGDVVEIEMGKA